MGDKTSVRMANIAVQKYSSLKISFGECKLQVRNYKPDACAKPSACKCI